MADTGVSACGHADFREHIPPRATNDGVIIREGEGFAEVGQIDGV